MYILYVCTARMYKTVTKGQNVLTSKGSTVLGEYRGCCWVLIFWLLCDDFISLCLMYSGTICSWSTTVSSRIRSLYSGLYNYSNIVCLHIAYTCTMYVLNVHIRMYCMYVSILYIRTLHGTLCSPCRQGAVQQLHHDFTELKAWLTEAVEGSSDRVRAQVSYSPALACLAQGLDAMLGREPATSALSPPTAEDVMSLATGDRISPFFQHILSLPMVSDRKRMFDCTNLDEWKQCMK